MWIYAINIGGNRTWGHVDYNEKRRKIRTMGNANI